MRHPAAGRRCASQLTPPQRSQFISLVSRFKVLAKMDIAEKRVPQDGAIALRDGSKRIDLRVSTVPTVYGEKMVMRILDKALSHRADRFGFRPAAVEGPRRVDPNASRPDVGDRPDGQRQEHDALCVPQQVERTGYEYLHGGRPGRVQVHRHQSGAGEISGGPDLCQRAARRFCVKTRT